MSKIKGLFKKSVRGYKKGKRKVIDFIKTLTWKHISLKSPSHHLMGISLSKPKKYRTEKDKLFYKEIEEAFENGYRQGSTKLAVKENAQEHSDVMKQNNFLLSEDMDEQIN